MGGEGRVSVCFFRESDWRQTHDDGERGDVDEGDSPESVFDGRGLWKGRGSVRDIRRGIENDSTHHGLPGIGSLRRGEADELGSGE